MPNNTNSCSLKTGRTTIKVKNRFTLHKEAKGKWKVSGRDSSGRYRRIRFHAETEREATRRAAEILHLPPQNEAGDFPTMEIYEALIRSGETRTWTPITRADDERYCRYFLDWVDTQGFVFWHELRFEHLAAYQKDLTDRSLSFHTMRLYLWPVRRAAKWMAVNFPRHYTNIGEGIRLSREHTYKGTYDEDQGNPVLMIPDLLDFLDFTTRHPTWNQLTLGAALQGLAGLQLKEALRLTWEKVDLDESTIIIEGETKNRYRIRKIPVCSVVHHLLQKAFDQNPGARPNPKVPVVSDFDNFRVYGRKLSRALKGWHPETKVKPKDLRNTLQTEAIDNGYYGFYVQRYVGHAPTTIGERHYHGDQGKRLLPLLREKVVQNLEQAIQIWQPPENTKILPNQNSKDCTNCTKPTMQQQTSKPDQTLTPITATG